MHFDEINIEKIQSKLRIFRLSNVLLEKCLYFPQDGLYIPLDQFQTIKMFIKRNDIKRISEINDAGENILLISEIINPELCCNHLIGYKKR